MFRVVGESLVVLVLLLRLRSGIGSRSQSHRFSSYEIMVPQQLLSYEGKEQETISYAIIADGRQHVLRLQQKTILVPRSILVFTYNKMGTLKSEQSNIKNNCYYHGYVDGVQDSLVAMSTCSGLQGFMKTDNVTYGIEPMESTTAFQHFIYRMDDIKFKCGVTNADERRYSYEFSHHFDPKVQKVPAESPAAYCIELFIVVENERYIFSNKKDSSVVAQVIDIVNLIDSMFKPLRVSVRLVGMEIWTAYNFIDLNGDPSTVLDRFLAWKEAKLVQRMQFDTAVLIVYGFLVFILS